MNVFDYIVEQLLEILRLAIYRYAGRAAPAPTGRKLAGAARAEAKVEAPRAMKKSRRARRRSAPWSNPLFWVMLIVIGGFVYRRLKQR